MQQLEWSDALVLALPEMDDTHREFVDLLKAVQTAPDQALLGRWAALIAHTQEHFDQEDRWMHQTGFASTNCHSTQHRVVLQVLREGQVRGEAGELALVRQMANELAAWFPQHAQAMDASLALHLRRTGFDPATGIVHMPDALPEHMIHGCAGDSCSSSQRQVEPATEAA